MLLFFLEHFLRKICHLCLYIFKYCLFLLLKQWCRMGDFYLISLYYAIAFLVFCAGIMRGSNLVQICHALGRAQINPTEVGVILGWKQSPLLQQGLGRGGSKDPRLDHPLLWEQLFPCSGSSISITQSRRFQTQGCK